jgi:hypothetical protein
MRPETGIQYKISSFDLRDWRSANELIILFLKLNFEKCVVHGTFGRFQDRDSSCSFRRDRGRKVTATIWRPSVSCRCLCIPPYPRAQYWHHLVHIVPCKYGYALFKKTEMSLV